jgi:hypothetical protein
VLSKSASRINERNRLFSTSWCYRRVSMATDSQPQGFDADRVMVLRQAIVRSFPIVEHQGKITNCDGAWLPELSEENAIHDDDMFVYEALTGRTWPEIPTRFLHEQPDGFVLLTDEALVAYLGAWLMCALEDMDGENIVREFVVYSFIIAQATTNSRI